MIKIRPLKVYDMKEKELSEVNTVAKVRGVDSNGNSVLIDPSSLPKSLYISSSDLNNMKYNANIAFGNGCSNIPFAYGFLLVSVSVIVGELIVLQTAYGRESADGKVSYRIYREKSGWGAWKIICAG